MIHGAPVTGPQHPQYSSDPMLLESHTEVCETFISITHIPESIQWVEATTLTRPGVAKQQHLSRSLQDYRPGCICPLVLDATSIAMLANIIFTIDCPSP